MLDFKSKALLFPSKEGSHQIFFPRTLYGRAYKVSTKAEASLLHNFLKKSGWLAMVMFLSMVLLTPLTLFLKSFHPLVAVLPVLAPVIIFVLWYDEAFKQLNFTQTDERASYSDLPARASASLSWKSLFIQTLLSVIGTALFLGGWAQFSPPNVQLLYQVLFTLWAMATLHKIHRKWDESRRVKKAARSTDKPS